MIKQRARRISRWFLLFLAGCVGAAVVVGAVLAIGWAGIGALKDLQIIQTTSGGFYEPLQQTFGVCVLACLVCLALKLFFEWVMWAFELDEVTK